MLKSVLGQLSDGMWENDNRYRTYWMCAHIVDVDGQLAFELYDLPNYYYKWSTRGYYKNQYYTMTDADVLKFFRTKLVAIWREYCKWNKPESRKLTPDNEEVCKYLGYEKTIKAKDIYELTELLRIAEEVR